MTGVFPKILSHPNIPKPLHGVNPRSMLGQQKWDSIRKKVYAKYDFHCAACGVSKHEAKKHRWLEAHENFEIDYEFGTARIVSIEPLCHWCHAFIHSGLLWVNFNSGKYSSCQFVDILESGVRILEESGGTIFSGTKKLCMMHNISVKCKTPKPPESMAEWRNWRMLWGSMEFHPKFDSYESWANHYGH